MVFLLHTFSCIFSEFAWGWLKAQQQTCALLEKSVLNMIWPMLPIFDWPIIMIGPGGLLLVVRSYMHVPEKSIMGGVPKN